MRFLFVCLGLWLTLLPLQSIAQELSPGDPCTIADAVTRIGGPGTSNAYVMKCNGTTWQSIMNFPDTAGNLTVTGNLTVNGTCTGCGGAGGTTLSALTDTNITTPADASLLIYDTGTSTWRDALLSGDVTINDLGAAVVADNSHNHSAANITSGTMATARLGSGTANATAVLLGDSTWAQLSTLTVGTATSATTAAALAANGSNCSAGQYARGVSATGAAEGCTAIPAGVTTLAGLDDTAITTPADGHILVYDSVAGDWENVAMSGDVTISLTGVTTVANNSHNHSAANITSGTMATARLGSGTADATAVLLGNSTWAQLSTLTVGTATSAATATTAGSLSGTPTLCTAGQYARGILANGNATGCTAAPSGADNLGNHIATTVLRSDTHNTDDLGTTAIRWKDGYFQGTVTATTFSGALSGNAATASALAANGSNCPVGQYARGVSAAGAAENCTAIPAGITTLAGLDDTAITTPANGHILVYDSVAGDWENVAMSGDVTINVAGATVVANDSHTHDTRYFTETESNTNFVNATGDTMSGTLNMGNQTITNVGQIDFNSGESLQDGAHFLISSDSGYLDLRTTDATHGLIIRDSNGGSTAWSGVRTTDSGVMQLRSDGSSVGYAQLELLDNGDVTMGGNLSVAGTISGTIDADTLDGVNSTSFLRSDADDVVSNIAVETSFYSGNAINNATGDQATLEVFNSGTSNDAFMQFHVSGDYAVYFGLDGGINDLAVGGWSMGAVSHRVWHAGNDGPTSGLAAQTAATASDLSCTDCIGATEISESGLTLAGDVTGTLGATVVANDSHTHDTRYFTETESNTNFVNATGDEMTGVLTIDTDTSQALIIDGSSTGSPYIRFQQAGTNRGYVQYVNGNMLRINNGTNQMDLTTTGLDINDLDVFDVRYVRYDSDERKKRDITPIDSALEKINQINGVTYFWKDEFASEVSKDKLHIGLIAQDVEAVFPELVNEDEKGYKDVVYAHLIAPVIEAVKEVWAIVRGNTTEIEASKVRIAELESTVETLLVRLNALETQE